VIQEWQKHFSFGQANRLFVQSMCWKIWSLLCCVWSMCY